MININDKIKQILLDKNLTPSYFADEIGVQRSSISHILSGRNRPSFDIIQKIIRRFPELGYEWIMEEESQQVNQSTSSGYGNRNQPRPVIERTDRFSSVQPSSSASYSSQSPGIRSQRNEIPPVHMPEQIPVDTLPGPVEPTNPIANIDKKVERILIFYTDGSFKEYMPST
ncbi:helix-turn-helix transcriptional regulator [Spirosoma horti]